MSRAIQIADAMAARLNDDADLAGITAMVWRQKDLSSEINRKVLQAGGAVIVILYNGFSNAGGSGALPNITRRFTLTISSKPILRAGQTPADDILETAARTIHQWEPDENDVGALEITVAGGDLQPDPNFLTYVLDIEVTSRL